MKPINDDITCHMIIFPLHVYLFAFCDVDMFKNKTIIQLFYISLYVFIFIY